MNDSRWFLIVANTANTLTVWGDMSASAASGAMYYIHTLKLFSSSECVDSGDNAALPADVYDLDGNGDVEEALPVDMENNPRVVDGPDGGTDATVDMGAYEYQGS